MSPNNFAQQRLLELLKKNRLGQQCGVYSICSSQENVIRAGMFQALREDSFVLIESTSNQVDQNGGYTGMRPKDFIRFVRDLASQVAFPEERILFGGDHLGPNVWQDLGAKDAMANARVLIEEYVKAGYQKIHLDASMFLADDNGDRHRALADEIVASRAADLCYSAEKVWQECSSSSPPPVYIIGTEVPIPGGAQEAEDSVRATEPDDVAKTIEITKAAFKSKGLDSAWERVVGVVVQPGVEFGDDQVFDYNSSGAVRLTKKIEQYPGLVYEAHSTDYQGERGLSDLVRDHFCILKVGPWLTFAYREAIFALELIERELFHSDSPELSNIRITLENVMLENSKYWKKYYPGTESQQAYKRAFSFSDRCRYYWCDKRLSLARDRLFSNLTKKSIPLSLISQYCPEEYTRIREGRLLNEPIAIVESRIMNVLGIYSRACGLSA